MQRMDQWGIHHDIYVHLQELVHALPMLWYPSLLQLPCHTCPTSRQPPVCRLAHAPVTVGLGTSLPLFSRHKVVMAEADEGIDLHIVHS